MTAVALAAWWSVVLPAVPPKAWLEDTRQIAADAEARRVRADYNTGSITAWEAYLLRALVEHLRAQVVIEVGTFIGTSTYAIAFASTVMAVYTCDASNDCLPSTEVIRTFPKQSSTHMLQRLVQDSVQADLCFFDGTLQPTDLDLLVRVCGPRTVFALHDYTYGPKRRKSGWVTVPRKGIGNARLLQPHWPTHRIVEPLPDTTLALLVPEAA